MNKKNDVVNESNSHFYLNYTISIWNPDNNDILVKKLYGHSNFIFGLIFLPNGNLATGSGDDTIKIWKLT